MNLKEIFKEGDTVFFSKGLTRSDSPELQKWLPLEAGYYGWVTEVKDDFIKVSILHPSADIYIQIKVYSPKSDKTNDLERTDSLRILRKKQKF